MLVWQKAIELVVLIYQLTKTFPKEELYGLTSQIRRAAVSVPANLAEGQGRRLRGEFQQFVGNARGSLLELDTHLELALRLQYLSKENHRVAQERLWQVGRLLNGLLRSLKLPVRSQTSSLQPPTSGA